VIPHLSGGQAAARFPPVNNHPATLFQWLAVDLFRSERELHDGQEKAFSILQRLPVLVGTLQITDPLRAHRPARGGGTLPGTEMAGRANVDPGGCSIGCQKEGDHCDDGSSGKAGRFTSSAKNLEGEYGQDSCRSQKEQIEDSL
jgi:hypothetical protein